MTKERATLPWRAVAGQKVFFISLGGPQAACGPSPTRDDKGEEVPSLRAVAKQKPFFITLGGPQARDSFAQDDAFLGGTEKHLVGCKKRERIEKVTGSQDDDFVGVLTKNILNKLTLMRRQSWVSRTQSK